MFGNGELRKEIEVLRAKNESLIAANAKLEAEVEQLNKQIERRNSKSSEIREKQTSDAAAQKEIKEQEYAVFLSNLGLYYEIRDNIFSDTEQSVFYSLNRVLANGLPKNANRLNRAIAVFPNIRIADFLYIHRDIKNGYDSAAYEVIKRHVDFLLCEYLSEGRNSRYVPLMAIEVRGKNHDLDLYVQKNDDFKERLFKQLDFPLCIIKNEDVKKVSVIDFSENLFQLLQNELKNKMRIDTKE
ncbi:hypothetical protein AGMMS49975_06660 [Clostridia bacterium]|nr:hypothetical protein AGMMS49975_06660 [Clostridia bacterium]